MLDESLLETSIQRLPLDARSRFLTYISEAKFFDAVLSSDLKGLAPGSRVIEIGSGIGLLALCTAARGFEVTAYEPQSHGFSDMIGFRNIITSSWDGNLPNVSWRDTHLSPESATSDKKAAFIFAVNVLEHVPNMERFIVAATEWLEPGGRFRFICPNYAFPYEPHFEIPTLLNKTLTFSVFQGKIRASAIEDPVATYEELSWPSVRKISTLLTRLSLRHDFSQVATELYLERVTQDASFVARKGPTVRTLFRLGSAAAPVILRVTPTSLLPVVDCTVYRDK